MRLLTLHTHGYLDYLTVALFALAPSVLGLSGVPAALSYLLAGVHVLMTLFTDFPLGVIKVIPFALHGWIERIVGPALVVVSFVPLIATTSLSMMFYALMGIVIIVVGLATKYTPDV